MTNFGWWQAEVMSASNNTAFMCMICFDVFPVCEAHEDAIGQRWDICVTCDIEDKEAVAAKREEACGRGDSGDGVEAPGPDGGGSSLTPWPTSGHSPARAERVTEDTLVPEYLSGAKLFAPTVAPALEGPTVPSGSRAAAEAPNPSP